MSGRPVDIRRQFFITLTSVVLGIVLLILRRVLIYGLKLVYNPNHRPPNFEVIKVACEPKKVRSLDEFYHCVSELLRHAWH